MKEPESTGPNNTELHGTHTPSPSRFLPGEELDRSAVVVDGISRVRPSSPRGSTGKAHSKTTTSSAKSGSKKSSGIVTMFTMKGDPIKALSGFKLPAGAQVAIVSSKPESVREIRKIVLGRVARVMEVVEKTPDRVRSIEKPFVDKSVFEPDARSRAMLEEVRIAQEDLRDAGGAYDLDQVRTLMQDVTRQAVDKRVQEGSLLAVPGPSNRRSYPTLQFKRDGSVVPGLKAVRDPLQSRNPWMILHFLSRPDDRLANRKPIDLLKAGNLEVVLEAARRHGEQEARADRLLPPTRTGVSRN